VTKSELRLPGLRELYEAYARAAGELPALGDPLRAEIWASAQLGTLERAAPSAWAYRLAVADLTVVLRRAGTPGAHAFLLVLAAIAPPELGRLAAKSAAALDGLTAPPWAPQLGQVSAGPAWLIQEGPLDGDRLVGEFRYPDGPHHHAIAVHLATDETVTGLVVVGDVPGMMADVRKAVQAELCTIQPVAPAAVAARLKDALNAELPEDCYPALALARHRIAVM
jgi:hypothetical protein